MNYTCLSCGKEFFAEGHVTVCYCGSSDIVATHQLKKGKDMQLCMYCGSQQVITDEGPKCINPNCPCGHRVDKALRYNEGKTKWSLVHFPSLEPMVEVLEFGAKKYSTPEQSGVDNWKKPMEKKQILESMMRHLIRLMEDEELDSESNLKHIGHIMCNAMFYSYHSK